MKKILIVDNEDGKFAQEILEADYDVTCVDSAEKAIEVFDECKPDLVLSDLFMPSMTGFDLHKILLQKTGSKVPIMYMTQDENEEEEGKVFDMGASDYIRKPFSANSLLTRIENVFNNLELIRDLKAEATIDKLTGFLNKAASQSVFPTLCEKETGVLMIIDLDSFKPVNDIYGHASGDKLLTSFAELIRGNIKANDVAGRIGGDEFILFLRGVRDEKEIASLTDRINKGLLTTTYNILGRDMVIPIGLSAGAVFVPRDGKEYDDLFRKADKALYLVKQNGKHGYAVYNRFGNSQKTDKNDNDMKHLSMIFEERSTSDGALWLGTEAFSNVYKFLIRYIQSYHGVAYKILFTLLPTVGGISDEHIAELARAFGDMLSKSLRKSDIMMQSKPNQFFLLLPDLDEDHVQDVVQRITEQWKTSNFADKASIICESEIILPEDGNRNNLNRRSS